MSGGSMDYLCYRVEEQASQMGDRELSELIKDVAELLHDREWYLSGDYGDETWENARENSSRNGLNSHARTA